MGDISISDQIQQELAVSAPDLKGPAADGQKRGAPDYAAAELSPAKKARVDLPKKPARKSS
jgi:hypothetical protein